MDRVVCVMIGYVCGNFLTAELVARRKTGKRAREIGSGNPGTVNIGAHLGIKWALVVLMGDVLKTAIPCMLCRFALFPDLGILAVLYAGVGASFGHNFPFWNWFRGGKGVAVTCAYIVFAAPLWGVLANLMGLFAVLVTGYLTAGAVLIPVLYMGFMFLLFGAEAGIIAAAGAGALIARHINSIRKIAAKQETKTGLFKRWKRKP